MGQVIRKDEDRGRRVKAFMVFGLSLAAVTILVTGAVFSDTASVTGNTITTGDVEISTSPATALLTAGAMVPGDIITAGITVSNSGTVQLRYAVKSTTTENTLAAQLDMTVWDETVEADAGTTCASTPPATVLYGPGDFGSTTGVNVVGNPAQGSHSGDRTLAASASEVLCFQVSLPSSTGNSYESLTSTATLDFVSEQTANN
jgi:spore coat-associated protein N